MEACILICRSSKEDKRQNKVLFINAVDEVVKKKTQSELSADHIERIASEYRLFEDVSGFARVVEQSEIAMNSYSLSIPIYVDKAQLSAEIYENADELFHNWSQASDAMRGQINKLKELL
jgi:type I restriction enzyme M protein